MIAVRSLCKRFGRKEILRDVNFDVAAGEVFAVIGPTGVGKTTLLRIVDLLDRPTSGTVYFDGQDVDASERVRLRMRRRMAAVLQKPIVFKGTVFDNVAYGLKVRLESKSTTDGRVSEALETVGLSGYEERDARTLSGGEVQRVALARAMALRPAVLLLDEPTANLDPVSTAQIEQLMVRVIDSLKTTVVMATHDFSQGQRLADRIGVLMGGSMVQSGAPLEVFGAPHSREIAEFVGTENIFEGTVVRSEEGLATIEIGDGAMLEAVSDLPRGNRVLACVRPEEVTLAVALPSSSARNHFPGSIARLSSMGPTVRAEVDCGFPIVAIVTRRSVDDLDMRIGMQVHASFKASGVHVIPGGRVA